MSNGESPGIGGIPEMKKPGTRAAQAHRGVWFAFLELMPRHLRLVQRRRHGLRSLGRRHG